MLFSTIGQSCVFLWMTGAGLLIGALYVLCAGLRRLLSAGFWLTLLTDMLFGACAGLTIVAALVTGSYGSLRLYQLLGVALGIVLFELGVAPLLRSAVNALSRAVRRIYDTIANYRLIKVIFK